MSVPEHDHDRQPLCDRCGVRPATDWVRRVDDEVSVNVQAYCDTCLAEGESQGVVVAARGPLDERLAAESDGDLSADMASGVDLPIHQPIHETDITRWFSDATRRVVRQSAGYAVAGRRDSVDTDDLLRAVLDEKVGLRLLDTLGADVAWIRQQLPDTPATAVDGPPPRLTPDAKRALIGAFEESLLARSSYLGPEHVLVALAAEPDSAAGLLLQHVDESPAGMRRHLPQRDRDTEDSTTESATPVIDTYARDLTRAACQGRLDPVVGRVDEIEQTIEILSRRMKNNPVLIGDPGVSFATLMGPPGCHELGTTSGGLPVVVRAS